MNQPSLSTTLALALPTLSLGLVAYIVHRFTTRISPNVPYVGEGSWKERLKVPVQYGKDPIGTLVKARKELGNVFCVDLLIFRVVFVLGAEGNREVLKSAEEDLSFWEQARWAFGPRLSASKCDKPYDSLDGTLLLFPPLSTHTMTLLVWCLTPAHATLFPFACGAKPVFRFLLNITDNVLQSYRLPGLE